MKVGFHHRAFPPWLSLVFLGGCRCSPSDAVLSDGTETVASVILGSAGEQAAFGFQINAPGVDSICQTAYVCRSKS